MHKIAAPVAQWAKTCAARPFRPARSWALSSLLLVGLVAPADGATLDAYVGADQNAYASWFEVDNGRLAEVYFVSVARRANTETLPGTIVYLGHGPCYRVTRADYSFTRCRARVHRKVIPTEDFQIDPLLGSAHLEITQGGAVHLVDWTGKPQQLPQAEFYQGEYFGGSSGLELRTEAYAGTYAFRSARASGRLFGDRFRINGGRYSYAALGQGAFAWTWFFDRGLEDYSATVRDGRLTVTAPRGAPSDLGSPA